MLLLLLLLPTRPRGCSRSVRGRRLYSRTCARGVESAQFLSTFQRFAFEVGCAKYMPGVAVVRASPRIARAIFFAAVSPTIYHAKNVQASAAHLHAFYTL